jgi:hypothetical protein
MTLPRRRGLGSIALALALAACTVEGEEVATTFFDPTISQSGTPPTGGEDDTETAGGSGGTNGSTGPADSGDTSTPATSSDGGSADASTGAPVDEQPDDGMYSACAGVGECIGLTTCVLAGATGFCSNAGCADAVADCLPNPSATSTASPACVDNGAGLQVCALSCAVGQTCPGGMDCVALGATMVCA